MDDDTAKKLIEQDAKLDAIFVSVEKTRNYFKWTLIATAVLFILPLIFMMFALPSMISTMTAGYEI